MHLRRTTKGYLKAAWAGPSIFCIVQHSKYMYLYLQVTTALLVFVVDI